MSCRRRYCGKDSFSYIHSQDQLVPAAWKKVDGLEAGDKKRASLAAAKPTAIPESEKGRGSKKLTYHLKAKMRIFIAYSDRLENHGNRAFTANSAVLLDMNHPLAGKNLVFDVKILRKWKNRQHKNEWPFSLYVPRLISMDRFSFPFLVLEDPELAGRA